MFIILALPVLLLAFIYTKFIKPSIRKSIAGRHVVVTGGSSGIGKCIAILAAQEGAHVTILARDNEKLEHACIEIRDNVRSAAQIINKMSVDVTNPEAVERAINEMERKTGSIYMLVNCAGIAVCGRLENISVADIRKMVNTNFLGAVFPIRSVLPRLKAHKEGIIVVTASQVALLGMYGYSVYSGCKFALRGMAESVAMEMKPYNVSVTLVVPPDTDTPGFELENSSKPEETRLMSETAGLFQPEEVAKKMLNDALRGKFLSYIGFEGSITTTLCAGMSPFSSILELVIQAVSMGFLRIIGAFYLIHFDRIVKRCHLDRARIAMTYEEVDVD